MRKILATLPLAILALTGCVGNVDSSSWSRMYSKTGVTAEQQQNDALDCVPTKAKIFNAWISDFAQRITRCARPARATP